MYWHIKLSSLMSQTFLGEAAIKTDSAVNSEISICKGGSDFPSWTMPFTVWSLAKGEQCAFRNVCRSIYMKHWVRKNQKRLRLPKDLFSSKPKLQFKSQQYIYQYFHSRLHFLTFMPKQNSVKGHDRTQVLLSAWPNKPTEWPSFTLAWSF